MATYGRKLRRGLPRRPGGDLWPAAGEIPADLGSRRTAPVTSTDASASLAESDESGGAVPLSEVVPPASAPRREPWGLPRERLNSASVAPSTAQPGRPASSPRAMRQGLPRTPAAVSDVSAVPSTPPGVEPVAEVGATGAATGARSPRRGLPRPAEGGGAPRPGLRTNGEAAPSTVPIATTTRAPSPTGSDGPPASRVRAEATPHQARSRWFALIWAVPVALIGLFAGVLVARWLRGLSGVASFMRSYPGHSTLPSSAPVGFPAWLEWQHFLSVFFIVLIVRTGWQVRTTRQPPAFWTRNNSGRLRTRREPKKLSLNLWLHFSLDWLWVANGVVFYVLIFTTGQWTRIVPVHWNVFPNAVSVAIQYASLHWPTDDGWSNYNALQLLSYSLTVFIAAPLAIATGLRMSPLWPERFARLTRVYKVEYARAVHMPVMVYFVAFSIVHVTLVLATGALRNLNHMYGGQDSHSWKGFGFFAASLLLMIIVWIAARPSVLAPIARQSGKVTAR